MKKVQTIISITLASALIISTPLLGEAGRYDNNSDNKYENNSVESQNKNEDTQSEKSKEKSEEKDEKAKEKEEEKAEKEKEKAEEAKEKAEEKAEKAKEKAEEKAEEAKEKSEEAKEKEKEYHNAYQEAKNVYRTGYSTLNDKEIELKKQLIEANKLQDKSKIEEIKTQMNSLKQERIEIKKEMKANIMKIKANIKSKYNNEELESIERVGNELQNKYKDIKTISVDNIYAKGKNIKFDSPALKKDDRTLIPVRAITEGFGAKVDWNQAEKIATIIKGDMTIELQLGNKVAMVNGKEVKLDVPSQSYSNRTYVPLRFVIENLGLNVNYDQETGLIEIEEQQEQK